MSTWSVSAMYTYFSGMAFHAAVCRNWTTEYGRLTTRYPWNLAASAPEYSLTKAEGISFSSPSGRPPACPGVVGAERVGSRPGADRPVRVRGPPSAYAGHEPREAGHLGARPERVGIALLPPVKVHDTALPLLVGLCSRGEQHVERLARLGASGSRRGRGGGWRGDHGRSGVVDGGRRQHTLRSWHFVEDWVEVRPLRQPLLRRGHL